MQSATLQKVYEYAAMFARSRKATRLECKHVLYALSMVDNEAKRFLADFGLNETNLQPKAKGGGGAFNDETAEILYLNTSACTVASVMGEDCLNCIHVLIAMLTMENTYAYNKLEFLLSERKRSINQLLNHIVDNIPNGEKIKQWCQAKATVSVNGSTTTETVTAVNQGPNFDDDAPSQKPLSKPLQNAATNNSFVREKQSKNDLPFGMDLTEKAAIGGFDPVIGREVELERLIQTLTRRSKNNPVLVGEAGVGKTAVVEGLATAIAQGHVPVELQDKRLIELDIAGMVAGTRYRGDFEERLTQLVSKVIEAGDVILFIDEIHNMVGAGGTTDGALNAAEILKPALARGELRIVGATTTREYRQYIEKDPALERRFQPILVDEPSIDVAIQIVKGVKSKYEKHHGLEITDGAVESAVNLSVRYVTDRYLPDKAFDIIDEACSKLKISAYAVPSGLVELANELKSIKRRLDQTQAQDLEQLNVLQRRYDELRYEFERQQDEFDRQREEKHLKLRASDVQLVVSEMTGIPVAELSREERDKLVHLEEELASRVIGQKQAVQAVARAVRRQRAGLKDPNKPIGSFVFVGPTGVGKTELAKALSDCLFGSDTEVIRIDMSEYMEKQSVSKLIGTAPGYVGYEENGYLTEKVQRKPYSVVLFDEIEKAHPDVFNLLLQILDEGRLTNSHGKTIDFRNTVIILTSNIGVSDVSTNMGFGARTNDYLNMRDNVERSLKKFFRPEFLNRLDEIVVFDYLNEEEAGQVAELLCFGLHKRLKGVIDLRFTEQAIKTLAQTGYDKQYGARPLKRVIQREVEDVLAEKLLGGAIQKGDTVLAVVRDNKIAFTRQNVLI